MISPSRTARSMPASARVLFHGQPPEKVLASPSSRMASAPAISLASHLQDLVEARRYAARLDLPCLAAQVLPQALVLDSLLHRREEGEGVLGPAGPGVERGGQPRQVLRAVRELRRPRDVGRGPGGVPLVEEVVEPGEEGELPEIGDVPHPL